MPSARRGASDGHEPHAKRCPGGISGARIGLPSRDPGDLRFDDWGAQGIGQCIEAQAKLDDVDMPLDWISRYLLEPPKQPEYRQKRSHRDFVESLGKSLADRAKFIELLSEQSRAQWQAHREWSEHPFATLHLASVQSWIDRRYGDAAWHFQR